jgi:hypothetical protein
VSLMARDLKPLPDHDPARSKLAAAIALHACSARDLQLAEQAAKLAERRFYDALSKLDAIREEPHAPSGALADSFIASVASGAPCNVATLERSSVESRAKLTAAENDVNVWKQTHEECEQAVRAKATDVVAAKEAVERCARKIVCDSAMAARLMDNLETKQAEIIENRVILRFIWGNGLNGELSGPDKDRIESLLRQDLTGWESHPVHGVWRAAFEELQSNPEAELPS